MTINFMEKLYIEGLTEIQLHRFMPLPGTIETNKICNMMYHDKTVSEITLTNINDPSIEECILKYPKIFSQYYTFDNEVKDMYQYFDIMVGILESMSEFYYYTFRFLIRIYGLEKFYFKMESILHSERQQELSLQILDVFKNDSDKKILFLNNILVDFFEGLVPEIKHGDVYEELQKYERYKTLYYLEKNRTPRILKFNINLYDWFDKEEIKYEDCYIKYKWVADSVHTTKMKIKR